MFQHTKNYIYPFQNLSFGFILKIFLKFCKFQPRYAYKIYSYKKEECILHQRQQNEECRSRHSNQALPGTEMENYASNVFTS